jgi:cell division protein FtsA
LDTADRIKKEFSSKEKEIENLEDQEIVIPEINSFANRYIPLSQLKEITDYRIDDILEHIQEKIEDSGFSDYISNGIVFTGGASQIAGLKERSKEYFKDYEIKMGIPIQVDGLLENMNKPENATGIGLLIYSIEKLIRGNSEKFKEKKMIEIEDDEIVEESVSITEKIKEIFSKLF